MAISIDGKITRAIQSGPNEFRPGYAGSIGQGRVRDPRSGHPVIFFEGPGKYPQPISRSAGRAARAAAPPVIRADF